MAVSIGLTPLQFSSGGKERLHGISTRGDSYLRSILIHGGRLTIAHAKHKDGRLSVWVTDLAKRRRPNIAAVALANKTVLMALAIIRRQARRGNVGLCQAFV
jgi:transposase